MKRVLTCTLLILLAAGCTTKSKARANAKAAFAVGRRQAMVEAQQTGIFFRGQVKSALVKWCEGLTLSRALAAAEYVGNRDPAAITITRNGVATVIDPEELLAGRVDPLVQPGDVVDLK
jgi:hypothetical protein